MTVADVLIWVFLILGLMLCLPAFFVMARGMMPAAVAGAERVAREAPGRALLLGLPVFGGGFVLGLMTLQAPQAGVKFLGALLIAASFGYSLTGASAWATLVGTRLTGGNGVRSTVTGGAALALSSLLPVLGWFLVLPAVLCCGAGALTIGFFRARPAEAAVA